MFAGRWGIIGLMRNGRKGKMTVAGRVRPGDEVFDGDEFVEVLRVRRAQGRKPAVGENLHLFLAGDHLLKRNSLDPVSIRRSASQSPDDR